MILSKNAVGNLINRYKAVLGKCRLINTFGSLALAAALTLGGAGLAVADPNPQEPGYWTGDVTVDTSIVVNTPFTEAPEGQNIKATSITLEGGSLTLQNGARLINGVPGTDGDVPERLAFTMTGGSLTLSGGNYDDGINASINAKSVDISGGTVNITGKTTPTGWDKAAQIGGYRGLTVSGGTVNMNSYSQLFGGGETGLQITGGTVNMLGDTTAGEVDNSAAHIMFGSTGQNLIAGNAHIVVGDAEGSLAGYGVMTTGLGVTMSGGALDVNNGELLLQPDTNERDANASLVYTGDATGAFNQTGGTVTIANQGAMTLNKGMTLDVAADGVLDNGGKVNLYADSTLAYSAGGDHKLTGIVANAGTLVVTNAHLDLTGAKLEKFSNTAGTIAVTRDGDNDSNQMARADMTDAQLTGWLEKDGSVTVQGTAARHARLHLGDNATVDAASITGGSEAASRKVTLLGYGSIQAQNIKLTGDALAIDSTGSQGNRIKANSLVLTPDTPDADFTLASGELFLKGEAGSALGFAGSEDKGLQIADKGVLKLGEDAKPGGDINANVTSAGVVDVAQGKWTLAAGKTLDIQKGSLKVGGGHSAELNIQGDLKSSAAGAGNGSNTGVNVMNNGVLSGAADKFVTYSGDTPKIAEDLAEVYVANGGTLRLDGLDEITLTQAKNTKNTLLTGEGVRNFV